MDWDWTAKLRELVERGEELVIATLLEVRGHAPREAGAKMLVTPGECFGTIGGGNVEKTALERARNLLRQGSAKPETFTLRLNPKEGEWGVQCCGGEVLLLLEPVLMRGQQVAIFGIGHVGLALAKVLSDLPFELLLVDSRPEMLSEARLKVLSKSSILKPLGRCLREARTREPPLGKRLCGEAASARERTLARYRRSPLHR
ncbi:MAG: hypothetical protein M1369_05005 [Deinococcus sp.]|nr:hypothetical protein [Deinococcus sp.]